MAHQDCTPAEMEWRVVPGFEAYEVSEYGHLRRIRPYRRHKQVGYILKQKRHQGGYFYYDVSMDGRYRRLYVQRAVAFAFLGEPPFPKAQAAHKNGNKADNHYGNIYWATHYENAQDNIRHGVTNAGEKSPTSKLTWKIVEEIRQIYFSSLIPYAVLAEKYGVSQECVREVLQGITWNDGSIKPTCLIRKGSTSTVAKLTYERAESIRKEYASQKISAQVLAEKYGVKRGTISRVLNNKDWINPDYVPQSRVRGALHMSAKLSQADVDAIRAAYATGHVTQYELAAQYPVGRGTIGRIINHRIWK